MRGGIARARGWAMAAASMLCLVSVAACQGHSTPAADPSPTTSVPLFVPAADCTQSTMSVPITTGLPSGTYTARTDATGTSLLITNDGVETLIVVPYGGRTTLQPTPDLNPTDVVNVSALVALTNTDIGAVDPNVPTGVALDQLYYVPPKYSVCGTTGQIFVSPEVTVVRDRLLSIAWRQATGLASSLQGLVTPKALKSAKAMQTCFSGALALTSTYPALDDYSVYANTLKTTTSCYKSYDALLHEHEQDATAAEEAASSVRKTTESLLEKAEHFLDSAHFLFVIERH